MAFFNDITLGQYFPVDSPVHRLDPRTKLLCAIIYMSWLLLIESWITIGWVIFIVWLGLQFSKIPLVIALKNIRPFIWLFLLTFFLHLFLSEGRILWIIPFLDVPIYREGLQFGLLYNFRLIILILVAALLTLTTSPVDLTDALNRLLAPLKKLNVPVHDFVMMMSLALRFIPTLLQEAERIQKAQMARGLSFDGSLFQKLKQMIPLLLPLFISAFRRAEELALAMDARCYNCNATRTNYVRLKFTNIDYWVMGLSIVVILVNVGFNLVV